MTVSDVELIEVIAVIALLIGILIEMIGVLGAVLRHGHCDARQSPFRTIHNVTLVYAARSADALVAELDDHMMRIRFRGGTGSVEGMKKRTQRFSGDTAQHV